MSPALDLLSLKVIVPAFYVSAGIAFFMGVVAAVLGSIGRRIPLYLAFSLVCFPAAGFIYFSGYYHGSASLAEAAWALRWQSACGFLAVPPFFWFIALYGGSLLLQIGSMVQGALVDFGYLQLFYTAGFAFLALVILMGVSMALDLRDQKFMLEVTAGLRQEIDRRTRAEDRIRRLAYYDPVTGLPNRA